LSAGWTDPGHVRQLALATSRLAVKLSADHLAAQDVVAMLTELGVENQRHCDAISALASRFDGHRATG
jgi:hypothetical protein